MTKIVVLASGSGSNTEAIIRHAQTYKSFEVKSVICDRPQALVLERAQKLNISADLVEKVKMETKAVFEQRLVEKIKKHQPDWIVLAGFMKMLSSDFLKNFYDDRIQQNKVINIHPSLLPLFPGKEAYEQSYKSGSVDYGCTIHFVNADMDTGKIIYQERLQKITGESLESFKRRGLALENKIYPLILEKLFKEYSN